MRTYSTSSDTTAYLKDESVDIESADSSAVDPIIEAASSIYERFGKRVIVTSAADGNHMRDSKHYSGEALDIRGSKAWGYSGRILRQIVTHLREQLGDDFDVVRESTHLHIERDPSD